MYHLPRICVALAALLGQIAAAQSQSLAPNRALYIFEPSRASQSGGTVPVDGRIAYELTGSDCAGYEVDSRVANIYANDNQRKRLDTAAATFESSDGKKFEVRQTQYVNLVAGEEEHTTVARNEDGAGAGTIRGSKKIDFTLKPEVLFPSAYEKKLIALALRGEKHDTSLVFDGSDSEKVFRAVAIIGPLHEPGTVAVDKANPAAAPLLSGNSWTMSVSYFPAADDKAESPDYQTDFIMYENGITSDMTVDYGDYALRGRLAKLEMLPVEPCTPGSKTETPQ
jgi:EipB-like